MIRHILVFSFKPDIDARDRDTLIRDLAAFPARYPAMTGFEIGTNISRRDDTFSHGMTVSFRNESDLLDYLNSDFHEEFTRERFRPLIAKRAIVSMVV